MELEKAAGAQVKTEMDTSGDNMNSGIQVAEEDLMMSLNLKEQLQVMTELNQSIGEKMKCLEELRMQTLALDSSMTTLKEKTIPEITSTVSKSGGEIVQSISALIGNSLLDIHGKIDKNVQRVNDLQTSTHNIHGTIDDLHHKNAKIEGKIFSLEETMEVELAKLKEVSLSKIERLEMLHMVGGDLQSVQANAIQHIREELHERLLPCREWVDERLHFFLDLREEEAKKKGRRR